MEKAPSRGFVQARESIDRVSRLCISVDVVQWETYERETMQDGCGCERQGELSWDMAVVLQKVSLGECNSYGRWRHQ